MPKDFRREIEQWLGSLRDDLNFTREQLLVLCFLAVLMAVGGLLMAKQSQTRPVVKLAPAHEKPAAAKPRKTRPALVYVHVAGAVARPGLYTVRRGERVAKAIEAAGGAGPEAVLDQVNLAAKVSDGQKILVPEKGEAPLNPGEALPAATGPGQKLDVNSATQAQLEELDGVGPVLAKRILAWREKHGRFNRLAQLDDVEGIGPKKFGLLKDQLTVE